MSVANPRIRRSWVENFVPYDGLPPGALPRWANVTLDVKLPMVPGAPKDSVVLCTTKLCEKIQLTSPHLDFDLSDPLALLISNDYHPLHDPHLKPHLTTAEMKRRLYKGGFITKSGRVVCTLKEFNEYRQYLCKINIAMEKRRKELEAEPSRNPREKQIRDAKMLADQRDKRVRQLKERLRVQYEADRQRIQRLVDSDLEHKSRRLEQLNQYDKEKAERYQRVHRHRLNVARRRQYEEERRKVDYLKRWHNEDERRRHITERRRQERAQFRDKQLQEKWGERRRRQAQNVEWERKQRELEVERRQQRIHRRKLAAAKQMEKQKKEIEVIGKKRKEREIIEKQASMRFAERMAKRSNQMRAARTISDPCKLRTRLGYHKQSTSAYVLGSRQKLQSTWNISSLLQKYIRETNDKDEDEDEDDYRQDDGDKEDEGQLVQATASLPGSRRYTLVMVDSSDELTHTGSLEDIQREEETALLMRKLSQLQLSDYCGASFDSLAVSVTSSQNAALLTAHPSYLLEELYFDGPNKEVIQINQMDEILQSDCLEGGDYQSTYDRVAKFISIINAFIATEVLSPAIQQLESDRLKSTMQQLETECTNSSSELSSQDESIGRLQMLEVPETVMGDGTHTKYVHFSDFVQTIQESESEVDYSSDDESLSYFEWEDEELAVATDDDDSDEESILMLGVTDSLTKLQELRRSSNELAKTLSRKDSLTRMLLDVLEQLDTMSENQKTYLREVARSILFDTRPITPLPPRTCSSSISSDAEGTLAEQAVHEATDAAIHTFTSSKQVELQDEVSVAKPEMSTMTTSLSSLSQHVVKQAVDGALCILLHEQQSQLLELSKVIVERSIAVAIEGLIGIANAAVYEEQDAKLSEVESCVSKTLETVQQGQLTSSTPSSKAVKTVQQELESSLRSPSVVDLEEHMKAESFDAKYQETVQQGQLTSTTSSKGVDKIIQQVLESAMMSLTGLEEHAKARYFDSKIEETQSSLQAADIVRAALSTAMKSPSLNCPSDNTINAFIMGVLQDVSKGINDDPESIRILVANMDAERKQSPIDTIVQDILHSSANQCGAYVESKSATSMFVVEVLHRMAAELQDTTEHPRTPLPSSVFIEELVKNTLTKCIQEVHQDMVRKKKVLKLTGIILPTHENEGRRSSRSSPSKVTPVRETRSLEQTPDSTEDVITTQSAVLTPENLCCSYSDETVGRGTGKAVNLKASSEMLNKLVQMTLQKAQDDINGCKMPQGDMEQLAVKISDSSSGVSKAVSNVVTLAIEKALDDLLGQGSAIQSDKSVNRRGDLETSSQLLNELVKVTLEKARDDIQSGNVPQGEVERLSLKISDSSSVESEEVSTVVTLAMEKALHDLLVQVSVAESDEAVGGRAGKDSRPKDDELPGQVSPATSISPWLEKEVILPMLERIAGEMKMQGQQIHTDIALGSSISDQQVSHIVDKTLGLVYSELVRELSHQEVLEGGGSLVKPLYDNIHKAAEDEVIDSKKALHLEKNEPHDSKLQLDKAKQDMQIAKGEAAEAVKSSSMRNKVPKSELEKAYLDTSGMAIKVQGPQTKHLSSVGTVSSSPSENGTDNTSKSRHSIKSMQSLTRNATQEVGKQDSNPLVSQTRSSSKAAVDDNASRLSQNTPYSQSQIRRESQTKASQISVTRRLSHTRGSHTSNDNRRSSLTRDSQTSVSRSSQSQTSVSRRASQTRDNQTSVSRRASQTRDSQTSVTRRASQTRDSQTSVTRRASQTRDSQTNVTRRASQTRDSQTSVTRRASQTRDIQTSVSRRASQSRDSQTSVSRQTSQTRDSQTSVTRRASQTRDSQTSFSRRASQSRDSQTSVSRQPSQTRDSQTKVSRRLSQTGDRQTSVNRTPSQTRDSQTSVSSIPSQTRDIQTSVTRKESQVRDSQTRLSRKDNENREISHSIASHTSVSKKDSQTRRDSQTSIGRVDSQTRKNRQTSVSRRDSQTSKESHTSIEKRETQNRQDSQSSINIKENETRQDSKTRVSRRDSQTSKESHTSIERKETQNRQDSQSSINIKENETRQDSKTRVSRRDSQTSKESHTSIERKETQNRQDSQSSINIKENETRQDSQAMLGTRKSQSSSQSKLEKIPSRKVSQDSKAKEDHNSHVKEEDRKEKSPGEANDKSSSSVTVTKSVTSKHSSKADTQADHSSSASKRSSQALQKTSTRSLSSPKHQDPKIITKTLSEVKATSSNLGTTSPSKSSLQKSPRTLMTSSLLTTTKKSTSKSSRDSLKVKMTSSHSSKISIQSQGKDNDVKNQSSPVQKEQKPAHTDHPDEKNQVSRTSAMKERKSDEKNALEDKKSREVKATSSNLATVSPSKSLQKSSHTSISNRLLTTEKPPSKNSRDSLKVKTTSSHSSKTSILSQGEDKDVQNQSPAAQKEQKSAETDHPVEGK